MDQWKKNVEISNRIEILGIIPTKISNDTVMHILTDGYDYLNLCKLLVGRDDIEQRRKEEFPELRLKDGFTKVDACYLLEETLGLKRFEFADSESIPKQRRIVKKCLTSDEMKFLIKVSNTRSKKYADDEYLKLFSISETSVQTATTILLHQRFQHICYRASYQEENSYLQR